MQGLLGEGGLQVQPDPGFLHIAAGQVAVTVDVLEAIDIAAALVGTVSGVPVAVNRAVGVVFTREASNVNDTVDAYGI